MKVLLIAGHGNGDSGAVGCGYKEADLTREVVSNVKTLLSKYCTVDVYNIAKNCYAECKNGRVPNFNSYNYVLEIHFNAGVNLPFINYKTTGTEIYITRSEKTSVCEQFIIYGISALGFKNRGVKRKDFTVIYNAKKQGVSSALLEVCFIDDLDDVTLYQRKKIEVAEAIVNGIVKAFKLTPKSIYTTSNISTSTSKNNGYKVKITASVLNVRAGAGTNYKITTTVKQNEVYTIVNESNGWGKLKSGMGWIKLSYTKKL